MMITFEALQERTTKYNRAVHIENNSEGLKDPSCVICYPPREISEEFDKFWNWYQTKVPAITYSEYTIRKFKDLLRLEIGEQNLARDTRLINLIGSIRYSKKPELTILDIATKIIEIFICSKYFELSIEQAERNLEELQEGLPGNSGITGQEQEQEEPKQIEQEELFDTGIEYEVERTLEELESINRGPETYFEEISESEKSEETTKLTDTEDFEITSEDTNETESEFSDYNLNELFEENLIEMAGLTDAQFR